MNIGTILKAVFTKVQNLATYKTVLTQIEALIAKNVPTRILNLYNLLIQSYEVAFASIEKLCKKVKTTPNELDNFCLKQALNLLKKLGDKITMDATAFAADAGIDLTTD